MSIPASCGRTTWAVWHWLLGEREIASDWFIESRDCCLAARSQPTIYVMVLLSMAALALAGMDASDNHPGKFFPFSYR
ncbi:MAG: hypothetical protein CSA23_00180 [Deltaproteobacteria bacterium]|nr:MAG: hypothetical protein CSA23_00180 [Deltaproteobacteria bacterium]